MPAANVGGACCLGICVGRGIRQRKIILWVVRVMYKPEAVCSAATAVLPRMPTVAREARAQYVCQGGETRVRLRRMAQV